MNYTNIKRVLKHHVDNSIKSLWTFDEDDKVFTQIYNCYTDILQLYTPQQLIDKLNNQKNERKEK